MYQLRYLGWVAFKPNPFKDHKSTIFTLEEVKKYVMDVYKNIDLDEDELSCISNLKSRLTRLGFVLKRLKELPCVCGCS